MEKDIETTEQVTTTETVTVCDKCGLEAEDPVKLYESVERDLYENSGDRPHQYRTNLITRGEHGVLFRYETEVPSGRSFLWELRDEEPVVEICEDCYEELFEW